MSLTRFALALAVAAVLVVPASASAATTSCSGSVGGGFWSQIKATDIGCASAKGVIKQWIKVSGFGHVDPAPNTRVGDYSCTLKFKGQDQEAGKLTCKATDGRKVTSVGAP